MRFLSRYQWLLLLLAVTAACGGNSQTAPSSRILTGQWTSTLTRPPCVGDWSVFTLQLAQSGTNLTGTLVTKDNQQFPAAGTFDGQSGNIVVVLPTGTGECGAITFTIQVVDHDSSGHITAFSGQATGRCCGTILETFPLHPARRRNGVADHFSSCSPVKRVEIPAGTSYTARTSRRRDRDRARSAP